MPVSSSLRPAGVAAFLAWLLAFGTTAAVTSSCSTEGFQFRSCSDDAQCREAFGFGSVCGKAGYCTEVQPTARCSSTYPDDLFTQPQQHRKTVVIASLMDHSSEPHVTRERAIRLAIKGANDNGGLPDQKFGLVMCDIRKDDAYDDLSRTAAAVASANFVARTLGVPAIVGPSASSDAEQVWEAVRSAGTLVISPAATSPALSGLETNTSDESPGLLWRTTASDSLQGRVIAEDMLARKVNRAYVVREIGSYGEGLASVFAEHFGKGGGNLMLISISTEAQAMEAAAAIAAADPVQEPNPDLVVKDAPADPPPGPAEVLFVSSQQNWIPSFLKAAATQPGFASRSIFLTDAAANQSVITDSASAAALFPRLRGTRPAPRDPQEYVLASFIADYRAEYGGASPTAANFSAHAFDAAWLTLYGAAWSTQAEGRVTGAGIARGLRRISTGMEMPILPASWQGVAAAFRAGQSINVRGASGDLDYNPVTRELTAPVEIWTIGPQGGPYTLLPIDIRTPGTK